MLEEKLNNLSTFSMKNYIIKSLLYKGAKDMQPK